MNDWRTLDSSFLKSIESKPCQKAHHLEMKQRSGWDLEGWRRAAQRGRKQGDSPIRPIPDSLRKIHWVWAEVIPASSSMAFQANWRHILPPPSTFPRALILGTTWIELLKKVSTSVFVCPTYEYLHLTWFISGHVCDFIITVPVGASTDMEAMGRFILQNRGRLTPMLVALNRSSLAEQALQAWLYTVFCHVFGMCISIPWYALECIGSYWFTA